MQMEFFFFPSMRILEQLPCNVDPLQFKLNILKRSARLHKETSNVNSVSPVWLQSAWKRSQRQTN